MAFQINGNTIIDSSGSLIVNANTSIANNFSVQLTPFASRESTSPMQGTVAGFTAGGNDANPPPVENNTIDKFPFANELTAVDHGDLTAAKRFVVGHSSDTDGFTSGGLTGPGALLNVVDKFPFSTTVGASDHGDLSEERYSTASQSSGTHGYVSGGYTTTPAAGTVNIIDKFLFTTNVTASDIGDLSQARRNGDGNSSETDGYTSGGTDPAVPGDVNTIDKFPFASDAFGTASDVGDLTLVKRQMSGQSSKTHGYISGGVESGTPTEVNVIEKFPFATDTNSTDVGDLVLALQAPQEQSSRENGYASGGDDGTTDVGMIQKFPFATDTNASDVGSLTVARSQGAGQQD